MFVKFNFFFKVSNTIREWMTKRDHRLTGNMYVISGLESIKDD